MAVDLESFVDTGAVHEVYAIRYHERETTSAESYYLDRVYGEGDRPLTMAYYLWLLKCGDELRLVDTGYASATSERRGRGPLVPGVPTALTSMGVDPAAVSQVFLSHLHFDHTGNLPAFGNARATVDQAEYDFWYSQFATRPVNAWLRETGDLSFLADMRSSGTLDLVGPDEVLAPGVRAKRVGGHTPGQQIITVNTASGPVVLASDAIHFYEEMDKDRPFALFTDLVGMFEAYALLRDLQDAGARIIAGHDPLVTERYGTVDGQPHVTKVG